MTELLTRKGRYGVGEPVELLLRLGGVSADNAEITVWHLAQEVYCLTVPLAGEETIFSLPPFERDGECYGVEARLPVSGAESVCVATAVNLGGEVVRYGFLSDFKPEDDSDVETLAAYHIDHVQFYDWSWKHDTLVAPADEYSDMMGKHNSLPVIRQKIAACHAHGMLAMAYGAVYAASRTFWEAHREWGLYAGVGRPMVFIDTFYYMDLESPWREHLLGQYVEAVERVGFDGVHMDTYGEPKRALSVMGEPRALEHSLATLIADADTALRRAGHIPHLIFNNVGMWPVELTRDQPQDAVYVELWPPMDQFHHLRDAVQNAAQGNKPVVLAPYPAPFRTDTPDRALYSELITSFAIALLGATQLFLGEKDAVVTQGYYADYTVLNQRQRERIKAYQDFLVRYQELFYDRTLLDVSRTHFGWDNQEYRCESPCSVEGEPDRLWLTLRENDHRRLIGLINLCGCMEDHWNLGKDQPIPQKNITLHILLTKPVQTAWYASPDDGVATPKTLECRCVEAPLGWDVTLTVPHLEVAALVWIELTP